MAEVVDTPEKLLKNLVDNGMIYLPEPLKEFKEVPAYPFVKAILETNQKMYEHYKRGINHDSTEDF